MADNTITSAPPYTPPSQTPPPAYETEVNNTANETGSPRKVEVSDAAKVLAPVEKLIQSLNLTPRVVKALDGGKEKLTQATLYAYASRGDAGREETIGHCEKLIAEWGARGGESAWCLIGYLLKMNVDVDVKGWEWKIPFLMASFCNLASKSLEEVSVDAVKDFFDDVCVIKSSQGSDGRQKKEVCSDFKINDKMSSHKGQLELPPLQGIKMRISYGGDKKGYTYYDLSVWAYSIVVVRLIENGREEDAMTLLSYVRDLFGYNEIIHKHLWNKAVDSLIQKGDDGRDRLLELTEKESALLKKIGVDRGVFLALSKKCLDEAKQSEAEKK